MLLGLLPAGLLALAFISLSERVPLDERGRYAARKMPPIKDNATLGDLRSTFGAPNDVESTGVGAVATWEDDDSLLIACVGEDGRLGSVTYGMKRNPPRVTRLQKIAREIFGSPE